MRLKNPWGGLRGLPADVWIISATTLVNRAGMMALPFLVLYLTRHLGVPVALAGLALTAYGVGGVVTAPIAGRLVDAIGPFTVIRASLALTGVVLFVIPLAHSFALVVALTFIWAVIADAARPATLSALTVNVPSDKRRAAVALNRLAVNLGMSIGPAVGGFLAQLSFPLLFIVNGAMTLSAAALFSALLASHRRRLDTERVTSANETLEPPAERPRAASRVSVLRDGPAMAFFVSMFLVGLVFTQHQGAMPVYLVRGLHYRESFYGLLFSLNTLLIVAIEVPLNLAMGHWSHRRAVILGVLLFAVGFGAMGIVTSALGLALTTIIWTFGEMILFPVSTAYVADIAPAGRTGEYMGAFSSTFSLALIVGPWAGTAALDRFGPAVTWGGVFVCGLLAAGTLWLSRDVPAVTTEPVAEASLSS